MILPSSGIGLRSLHLSEILNNIHKINWIEIHTENLMVEGGIVHEIMRELAHQVPLSFHGIGLSLGSADGLCDAHIQKIKNLIKRYNPTLVSEHVSWNQVNGLFLNDLLPVPYTEEALKILAKNISHFQNEIGRQILIENPSSYLEYKSSEMTEPEFMIELCRKADCKILLDIHNIYVSYENHGWDTKKYIDMIPETLIGEYHLAGHADVEINNEILKIDDHGSDVPDEVWELYEYALAQKGPQMTLIE